MHTYVLRNEGLHPELFTLRKIIIGIVHNGRQTLSLFSKPGDDCSTTLTSSLDSIPRKLPDGLIAKAKKEKDNNEARFLMDSAFAVMQVIKAKKGILMGFRWADERKKS